MAIADAAKAVFVPAHRLAAGHVVGEKAPGAAVFAVVLPHRAPRSLGKERAPFAPALLPSTGFFEANVFGGGPSRRKGHWGLHGRRGRGRERGVGRETAWARGSCSCS